MMKKPSEAERNPHIHARILKSGKSPGTPVFVGQQRLECPRIDIIAYSMEDASESFETCLENVALPGKKEGVTWLNVTGVHDVALIEKIGRMFDLHPLTLEDIANTTQRPKAEEYDSYIFLALKMITYNETDRKIEVENVSLVLGSSFVLSFQELGGDVFGPVRARIKAEKSRIRKSKADYLIYSLMDAIIDEYFVALEKMSERIEILDEEIVTAPERRHLNETHRIKRDIFSLRKAVWPLREVVSMLEKTDSKLVEKSTKLFMRDLYDHTIQAIDMVEIYRDILSGMDETYMSSVNYRLNDIMKVLTTIATIFIPLTFIVGVYGMNFHYMPELTWRWGYFSVWGVMAAIAALMLLYFQKKGWFKS